VTAVVRQRSRVGAALACAALAVAAVLAGCAPLNQPELMRQAGSVQATAGEGTLLAQQVALDRTKDTFVRVHGDELASQMDATVAKLRETIAEDEVPGELRDQTVRVITLAQRASDALTALTYAPGDPATGADSERRLRQIADQAARLVEEL
jgi:hypothetical protein